MDEIKVGDDTPKDIDLQWDRMLANFAPPHERGTGGRYHAVFWPLLPAASEEPVLRQLFPYTSLWTLAFSRTSEGAYRRDVPAIGCLSGGRYEVRMGARGPETLFETTDPVQAVEKVVERLSPHG